MVSEEHLNNFGMMLERELEGSLVLHCFRMIQIPYGWGAFFFPLHGYLFIFFLIEL